MSRSDGKKLKSLSAFEKIIPHIMTRRSDAQVFSKQIIVTDTIDKYIQEKQEQGIRLTYMHIFISIYVRLLAQRPKLNRFVMNNRLYARKGIFISMAIIRRSPNGNSEETTVKFPFTGHENIFEIADIVNRIIAESKPSGKTNNTDELAEKIMSLPHGIVKILVGLLKWMDRHNLLPQAMIEASPFHTSLFFTYLKSIKLDYIYHHIYDFGTTGIFAALGKRKQMPIVEHGAIVIKNCCEIGYVLDERICDGLYFSYSFKLMQKYLDNPYLLEERLEKIAEDVG
jgi:hypothetical protein